MLLLTGCVEYRLGHGDAVTAPDSDASGPGADGTGDGTGRDECNGVDDDGDGLVDEDSPDHDGDGIPDCLDDACDVSVTPAHAVDVDAACGTSGSGGVVDDPWNVDVEWRWDAGTVWVEPLIGNLTDDDGDGAVTDLDTPDVVVMNISGWLFVIDGATGTTEWSRSGLDGDAGIAVADADADGLTDIATVDNAGHPTLLSGDGDVLWTSPGVTYDYPQVTIADVDEDGHPEVLANGLVLDGQTGAVEATLPENGTYFVPTAADLDLDGVQDVLVGGSVYDPTTGALEWKAPFAGSYGHMDAVLDADGDPGGEVVMVGSGHYGLFDSDGTVLATASVGDHAGPVCVADFDGDGSVEVAWSDGQVLAVRELDGSVDWSSPVTDNSGLAGCSGYDVDGDGAYEVLYADEVEFWIFDGRTGATRFAWTAHSSETIFEYPTVADVDGDGSAEILVAGDEGVTAFGQVDGTWRASGRTWATHDFAVTNVDPDGHVPAVPSPPWLDWNVYRARPTADVRVDAPDLLVQVDDLCVASCEGDGPIEIAWHVENIGAVDVDAGVDVTLYRVDGATQSPVARVLLPAVTAGQALEGQRFEVAPGDVGADGFVVRVDALGHVSECRETNDTWAYGEALCEEGT